MDSNSIWSHANMGTRQLFWLHVKAITRPKHSFQCEIFRMQTYLYTQQWMQIFCQPKINKQCLWICVLFIVVRNDHRCTKINIQLSENLHSDFPMSLESFSQKWPIWIVEHSSLYIRFIRIYRRLSKSARKVVSSNLSNSLCIYDAVLVFKTHSI